MYVINSNFSFHLQDGSLNTNDTEKFNHEFKDYPEKQTINLNNSNILIFKHSNNVLAVEPQKVVYVHNGDAEHINIDQISDQLSKAIHIGSELTKGVGLITLELTEEYNEGSSLVKSVESFSGDLNPLSPIGVGYRFVINNGACQGNVNIEPFLKDENRIYYNLVLETIGKIDVSELKNTFMDMMTYVERAREVAKSIYL